MSLCVFSQETYFVCYHCSIQPEGPRMSKLPDTILQAISRQLAACSDKPIDSITCETLQLAKNMITALIVLCRWVLRTKLPASLYHTNKEWTGCLRKKDGVADNQYFKNGNTQQCNIFRLDKYNFYLVVWSFNSICQT